MPGISVRPRLAQPVHFEQLARLWLIVLLKVCVLHISLVKLDLFFFFKCVS